MSKNPHYEALGFYHIIEKLKELALSEQAKAVLDRLEPFMKEEQCISKMKETTEMCIRDSLHFDRHAAGQILCLGTPIAAQDALSNLSFLIITAIINSLGVV